MSYDGMVTHCITDEINRLLSGARVDKIHQPERDEIILQFRSTNGVLRLLLSASAMNPRVHLTHITRENPMTPPMFCMLLRKHLQGSVLLRCTQQDFDRILCLDFEGRNEMGDLCVKSLIVEIMGRHSNIILVDDTGRIMDSAKHVDFTVSAVRQILPGLSYEAPPPQDKRSIDDYTLLDLVTALDHAPEDTLLDKFLLASFMGLSPLLAREIVYRFCQNTKVTRGEVDTAAFATAADTVFQDLRQGRYRPTLILSKEEQKPIAFSCIRLTQYENSAAAETADSMSEIIDTFFEKRAQKEHMHQRAAALTKLVHNNLDRCEKKLALHLDNLMQSKNRDTYKIYGDLITANLYRMQNGAKSLEAENYFSENQETVTIMLKEELSPSQNAQRYYKMYTKAKMTERYAAEQSEDAKKEKYYLESVLDSIEKAETPAELLEIKGELQDEGYLPKPSAKAKKGQKKSEPLRFTSADGYEILVGRNNKQNDELTIRMAYSTDIWLHTKNIPGSHTIIRTNGQGTAPDTTILRAAELAAYYSKAQNSSKVPVDYTIVKNVKKPNGAKPGIVIYDHYNTVYIDTKA